MTPPDRPGSGLDRVRAIATEVAAPAAAAVDRDAVPPSAALAALRSERLLGVGWTIGELAEAASILARACSATGMIWAMHHSQALTVVRHGGAAAAPAPAERLAEGTLLVASAASEAAFGGDLQRSDAMLVRSPSVPGSASVVKRASTLSYAAEADAFLVSCRASESAAATDLVLVLAWRDQCEVVVGGPWSPLGMRGTASPPVTLSASFSVDQVLPVPFESAVAATMVPVAHVLWGAAWTGVASAAVDRAREFVRARRRSSPSAMQCLAEAAARLRAAEQAVSGAAASLDAEFAQAVVATTSSPLARAAHFNQLKLDVSSLTVAAVLGALRAIGVEGYVQGSPWSVERQVRDILSSELMVSNTRLRDINAELELLLDPGRRR